MFEFVYEIICDDIGERQLQKLEVWMILGNAVNRLFTDDFVQFNREIRVLQGRFEDLENDGNLQVKAVLIYALQAIVPLNQKQ